MSARQSSATDRALDAVKQGATPYRAAKTEGIALSTIYRALKRLANSAGDQKREEAQQND